MPKINRDELNVYNYLAPCLDEQQQIGDFFIQLDNLLTLQQRELEKLKNIKKSMLEKMFV
jgi:type I restriction enzyme S subunit